MSISPFSARPGSPESERRRARLVLAIATVGIAATLLAYAISPGVRHAVGHAAHSVKGAVGHVLDRDKGEHPPAKASKHPARPAKAAPGASSTHPSGSKGKTPASVNGSASG